MTFDIFAEIERQTAMRFGMREDAPLQTSEIPKSLLKRIEPHIEHYSNGYTQDTIDNHGPRDYAEWAAMRSYNRDRI